MIVMIDNYDSFTYNLVQYLAELGAELAIFRNDAVTVEHVREMAPSAIVVSPGPCTPGEAGISVELIRTLGPLIPTLGVCLGHQSMGEAFGGRVIRAPEPVHGKVWDVHHGGTDIFAGLPSPFSATRYHSLIVERETLPDCLRPTAWTEDGLIMGLAHRELPVWGVQFHPESIASAHGHDLLRNFLKLAGATQGAAIPA